MQISMFDGTKPFKLDKPIRLIECFAGYGSQHFSLEYLGVKFESWRICEWAVKSIQAYKDAHFSDDNTDYSKDLTKEQLIDYLANKGISANYNEPMSREQIKRLSEDKLRTIYNNIIATHNLVNICQVHAKDLNIVDTDKYDYVLTYSFPCVTADSLILTKDGYKEFKDLQVGEYVLTKSNTWQKIAKKFDNGVHKTYYLQGMGFENIHCTANHKFWVREMYRKGHLGIRTFREPQFKEVKDITTKDYFGVPVIQEEEKFYTDDLDFWYMIGYYLGDGWLSKNDNDINLACNESKLEKLKKHLDLNKWNYTYYWNSTCYKFRFSNKEIRKFIEKYIGTGCLEKRICGEMLRLPKEQLNALLEGYIDSDGSKVGKNIQFSSVNRGLIYGISSIINKVYHRTTCITKNVVKPKKIIQGRTVNQHDWYLLRFKAMNDIQDRAFYEDGYLWYPFTKLIEAKEENVYNMEIENDHSYIIQGCISKNCQDLSLAGKQKGMEKGSGTRSGMLWEVERILDECDNLPQVLLMENVPEVIGSNNIKHFAKWLEKLESLGYKCYWKVLNGKDYGVPQNRERCFMVSILGDYYYNFPEPQKLKIKLKDILLDKVDEKFYLSDDKISSIAKWKAQQDPLKDIDKEKIVCPTLTARGAGEEHSGMILINGPVYMGTFQYAKSDNFMQGRERFVPDKDVSDTIQTTQKEGVVQAFGETEKKLFTEDGNIRRYVDSDIVDKFEEGQMATTTFQNGYGHGPRTHNESVTLNTVDRPVVKKNLRIRKLVPQECFRLMGVRDEDFEKIAKNQSDASLWHLAGDSIIVDVLMAIFKQML